MHLKPVRNVLNPSSFSNLNVWPALLAVAIVLLILIFVSSAKMATIRMINSVMSVLKVASHVVLKLFVVIVLILMRRKLTYVFLYVTSLASLVPLAFLICASPVLMGIILRIWVAPRPILVQIVTVNIVPTQRMCVRDVRMDMRNLVEGVVLKERYRF